MTQPLRNYLFDPLLGELVARPFEVFRPAKQVAPFVFASPHSGRLYPQSFVARSALNAQMLRSSEDAHVDELFSFVSSLGAPFLAARFPRAFVDANRSASELDTTMFEAPPALAHMPRTARVAAGLGVIPRVVRDGIEIYREPLPAGEAVFRLENFYRPYHAALSRIVHETRARFGVAVVVDCHSMPSAPRSPDIVIGDQYGRSAAPALVAHACKTLRALGFSVACNAPYAGGHTTEVYGKPAHGDHAIQIEINRALYFDAERLEPLATAGELHTRLRSFCQALLKVPAELLAQTRERETA